MPTAKNLDAQINAGTERDYCIIAMGERGDIDEFMEQVRSFVVSH